MKTKKYWILAVVIAVFAFQLWAGIATENSIPHQETLGPFQRTLVGISAIEVVVEELSKDSIKAGLTKRQIQTDVELRLRREGIRVVSEEDKYKIPGWPSLYVNVNSTRIEDWPLLAFSTEVKLKQMVFLERNPKIFSSATTWSEGKLGYAGNIRFVSGMRQSVSDLVDEFLNDYYAANPKEPEKKKPSLEELVKPNK